MGNNAQYNVAEIGTIKIKTHAHVITTLSKVCHVLALKRNLISLGTLESEGYKYSAEGEILQVSKGTRILLKGLRHRRLSVF